MRLPSLATVAWPVRCGLASGLASILVLLRDGLWDVDDASDLADVVFPVPLFATVTAVVCAGATRGASLQTSWSVTGGVALGCVLSALAVALLGSSLIAVVFSNSLVGVLVLYPRRFPVLAQKFAFGGSTIVLWGIYNGGSPRWLPIGLPITSAVGRAIDRGAPPFDFFARRRVRGVGWWIVRRSKTRRDERNVREPHACSMTSLSTGSLCAMVVTVIPCSASDATQGAARACAARISDALTHAVEAFLTEDRHRREMLRSRLNNERALAEAQLNALHGHAADARWERNAAAFAARLAPGGVARRRRNKKVKPEAAASVLRAAVLNLNGLSLALDALLEVDADSWRLLATADAQEGAKTARMYAGDPGGCIERVRKSACEALSAVTAARTRTDQTGGNASAALSAQLREGLVNLDAVVTEERWRTYVPSSYALDTKRTDEQENVGRRALQAYHLWIFSFENLARALQEHLEPTHRAEVECDECGPNVAVASAAAVGSGREDRDSLSAILQCRFKLNPDQALYALKLSFSCAVASLIGWRFTGDGAWAALTITMVGTRDGSAVGGSFNAALLRLQGTVVGAMFSFVLLVGFRGELYSAEGAARLAFLALFSFLTAFLRYNPEFAYGGIVAAFTAYIVALGYSQASGENARSYAHKRVEQNLLGLVIFVLVEMGLFPTLADDEARLAVAATVRATERAAEAVYDATVGTDCVQCRRVAAGSAQTRLTDVKDCLHAQTSLLQQAAAEPHLWTPKFPMSHYQTLTNNLEHVSRILGLMRAALSDMARVKKEDGGAKLGGGGGKLGGGGDETISESGVSDAQTQVRALLLPTERFIEELRSAIRELFKSTAEDLVAGAGTWRARANTAASIARAQASLERAFVLSTLQLRLRFQAGDASMFLPNHLMVPWHAYVLCTRMLTAHVESLTSSALEALLAVRPAKVGDADAAGEVTSRVSQSSAPSPGGPPSSMAASEEFCGVCVEGGNVRAAAAPGVGHAGKDRGVFREGSVSGGAAVLQAGPTPSVEEGGGGGGEGDAGGPTPSRRTSEEDLLEHGTPSKRPLLPPPRHGPRQESREGAER